MTKILFDNIFWTEFNNIIRTPPISNNGLSVSDFGATFLDQSSPASLLASYDFICDK
jgi:hypothetical protein